MSQSIWEKLEQELPEDNRSSVEMPDKIPQPAKKTGKERAAESVLKGTIPTAVFCGLGLALTSILDGVSSGGFELLGLVFAVLLFRPIIFNGQKVSNWLLLLAPLTLGGLTELFTTLPRAIHSHIESNGSSGLTVVDLFQTQLENFLSVSHLAIYLLCGVALVAGTRAVENRFFWLDLVRGKPWIQKGAKFAFLGLPFLFGSYMVWQHGWSAREKSWIETQAELRQRKEANDSGKLDWRAMLDAMPEDEDEAYGKKPTPEQARDIEKKILELSPPVFPGEYLEGESWRAFRVVDSLLKVDDELTQPGRLALFSYQTWGCYSMSHYSMVDALAKKLLPEVARVPVESEEFQVYQNEIDQSLGMRKDLFALIDAAAFSNFNQEMGYQLASSADEKPWYADLAKPVSIFGFETNISPVNIYLRRKHRASMNSYLLERERLKSLDRRELQKQIGLLVTGTQGDTHDMWRAVARIVEDQTDEHLIQAAKLIVELREYKAAHGEWPADLGDFAAQYEIDLSATPLSFDPETATLHYDIKHNDRRIPAAWRLQ